MRAIKPGKFIRVLCLIAVLVPAGSPSVRAEGPGGPDKRELLRRIMRPSQNINFRGAEISITIGKDGAPVVEKFAVSQRGKEFRRVKIEGDSRPDEIYIRNKSGAWIYYPKQGRLVKKEQNPESEEGLRDEKKFRRIQANYRIEFIKEKRIAGRVCSVYAFRPREKGRLVREFWVDTSSGLPLRIDTFTPDGRLLNVASFETIEFNPRFQQDRFKLNVKEKARRDPSKVLDVILIPRRKLKESLNKEIGFPGYIPKGYGLKNVLVQKAGAGKRYQMIYSDGMVPLSIFQEKIKGGFQEAMKGLEPISLPKGGHGYFKQRGLVKVLCFSIGESRKTIVGEINKNEMLKIAESFYSTKGGNAE